MATHKKNKRRKALVERIAKRFRKLGYGVAEFKFDFDEIVNGEPTVRVKLCSRLDVRG